MNIDLQYDYWTGHIKEIEASLNRSVSQYLRYHKKLKIGITNNPKIRVKQHFQSGIVWSKMIVKYHTSSVKYINQLEKILIDNHWDYLENKVGGGGGKNGTAPYYLYFLLN